MSRAQVTREPVRSSMIAAVGYDAATLTLEIEFKPNKGGFATVSQYSPVSLDEYQSLMGAPSIGKRFNALKASPEITGVVVERIDVNAPKEQAE